MSPVGFLCVHFRVFYVYPDQKAGPVEHNEARLQEMRDTRLPTGLNNAANAWNRVAVAFDDCRKKANQALRNSCPPLGTPPTLVPHQRPGGMDCLGVCGRVRQSHLKGDASGRCEVSLPARSNATFRRLRRA